MRKGKLSVVILLALALSLSLAASSWAQHRGMMNVTPEQAGQLFDLRQKFMNDTAGLRKDMAMKRAELAAIWRAENPDEKQILAKQKEINDLKAKLQEKAVAFRLQARKICPQMGAGFGPRCGIGGGGMGGPGCGLGMGPGAGMGPGPGMGPGGGS